MDRIPAALRGASAPLDIDAVADWWAGLSDEQRGECVGLWDARHDSCAHATRVHERGRAEWQTLPLVVGRFVGPDDTTASDDWRPDHFEYLMSHPEIWTHQVPGMRQYFIGCTRHEAARAALRAGHIPAEFACPLAADDCPMRKLLAPSPGRDLKLRMIGPLTPKS